MWAKVCAAKPEVSARAWRYPTGAVRRHKYLAAAGFAFGVGQRRLDLLDRVSFSPSTLSSPDRGWQAQVGTTGERIGEPQTQPPSTT